MHLWIHYSSSYESGFMIHMKNIYNTAHLHGVTAHHHIHSHHDIVFHVASPFNSYYIVSYYITNQFHCQVQTQTLFAVCYYASVENSGVDKYLSPESGSSATITFPLFSGRLANSVAAKSAAPEEIPTNTPSLTAISLPAVKASSLDTFMMKS